MQKCCLVFGKIKKKKKVLLNLSHHFTATLNTLECKVLLFLLMHSVKVLSYIIMSWFFGGFQEEFMLGSSSTFSCKKLRMDSRG